MAGMAVERFLQASLKPCWGLLMALGGQSFLNKPAAALPLQPHGHNSKGRTLQAVMRFILDGICADSYGIQPHSPMLHVARMPSEAQNSALVARLPGPGCIRNWHGFLRCFTKFQTEPGVTIHAPAHMELISADPEHQHTL